MTCPICRKPVDRSYRPFCSQRCADIDLARWFNESYRLPDSDDAPDERAADPAREAPEKRH